ncbi:MAG: nucleotidyl transferase AbiEii/AbiGii toxin family protein [Elusimicrobia bacterium]|nr:nucleotidyl transferase AbiEii/AbiGii toxin family protein [Elusimicrobiota bacterium]
MPIPRAQKDALDRLVSEPWARQFRLVNGTALAIQYGHRLSQDLGFFSAEPFDVGELVARLSGSGAFTIKRRSEFTVVGTWEGAEVTFLYYQYPWVRDAVAAGSPPAPLAHPLDIGLMKIEAIAQRGARRDFADLYFICQRELPLAGLLKLYPAKYGENGTPTYHLLKSLAFFEDAERQPEVPTRPKVPWKSVRAFFEGEVSSLAKSLLGLG